MLTLCWPKLTLSYPMFAYVALASANPHSSDRKGGGGEGVGTGSGGGHDAVDTSGVGGRGDRPYNLRLPTEGLRQGHGLRLSGRRPDLKADA